MASRRRLKGRIAEAKRGVKRAVEQARAGSEGTGGAGARNVNVAGRVNVVAAGNVGEDGSSREASGTQRVRIRQDGDETYEAVETTETTR